MINQNYQKIFIILFILLFGSKSFAQQDPMFTHYMYNTIAVNPGYAGSRDALTITGLHRKQWVDFNGSPSTQTFTLHTPFANDKIGIGLSIIADKIGPSKTSSYFADFAYRLKITSKSKLAFGIKGGVESMSTNLTSLKLDDQSDVLFQKDIKSKILPNFGAGIYYQREQFYAGFSIPKLLENDFSESASSNNKLIQKRHYYLITGCLVKLAANLDLKPTSFVKIVNGAPVEADVTTSFIINKRVMLGAMLRTKDATGFLLGFDFTDQMHAGYSFDWSFANQTFKYNRGSHEILLTYDFIYKDKGRIRSPRNF